MVEKKIRSSSNLILCTAWANHIAHELFNLVHTMWMNSLNHVPVAKHPIFSYKLPGEDDSMEILQSYIQFELRPHQIAELSSCNTSACCFKKLCNYHSSHLTSFSCVFWFFRHISHNNQPNLKQRIVRVKTLPSRKAQLQQDTQGLKQLGLGYFQMNNSQLLWVSLLVFEHIHNKKSFLWSLSEKFGFSACVSLPFTVDHWEESGSILVTLFHHILNTHEYCHLPTMSSISRLNNQFLVVS